jgi:hypothetical protein
VTTQENENKKRRTYLPAFFLRFLRFSCRETAKNAKKKSMGKHDRKKGGFLLNFPRPKGFDMDFPQNVFIVFLIKKIEKKSVLVF